MVAEADGDNEAKVSALASRFKRSEVFSYVPNQYRSTNVESTGFDPAFVWLEKVCTVVAVVITLACIVGAAVFYGTQTTVTIVVLDAPTFEHFMETFKSKETVLLRKPDCPCSSQEVSYEFLLKNVTFRMDSICDTAVPGRVRENKTLCSWKDSADLGVILGEAWGLSSYPPEPVPPWLYQDPRTKVLGIHIDPSARMGRWCAAWDSLFRDHLSRLQTRCTSLAQGYSGSNAKLKEKLLTTFNVPRQSSLLGILQRSYLDKMTIPLGTGTNFSGEFRYYTQHLDQRLCWPSSTFEAVLLGCKNTTSSSMTVDWTCVWTGNQREFNESGFERSFNASQTKNFSFAMRTPCSNDVVEFAERLSSSAYGNFSEAFAGGLLNWRNSFVLPDMYQRYFEFCEPDQCTFTAKETPTVSGVVIIVIGLTGGLLAAGRHGGAVLLMVAKLCLRKKEGESQARVAPNSVSQVAVRASVVRPQATNDLATVALNVIGQTSDDSNTAQPQAAKDLAKAATKVSKASERARLSGTE